MEERNIYNDIAKRTGGDIYIGVVGPVRTGKSTFIKKFMDSLVIPNILDDRQRDRTIDELPQSAGGRTIMTTEPKFIPEDAVEVSIDGNAKFRARVIDCVGYIVPSALGYIENEIPRMVMTPWFKEEIPFDKAAEIGTKKVITDHSTIGLVVTTDGSISDIERNEYEDAERRVIDELKELNKPFITLLNSIDPYSDETSRLSEQMKERYGIPVIPVNCMDLNQEQIKDILGRVLYEFPIREVKIDVPKWMLSLEKNHWLKSEIYSSIKDSSQKANKIREAKNIAQDLCKSNFVIESNVDSVDLGTGTAKVKTILDSSLFYRVLREESGINISGECELLTQILSLSKLRTKYERIREAYDNVNKPDSGYGIVMPTTDELILSEPEVIKQNGKYGIKLRASAQTVHLVKTNVKTELIPVFGSIEETQNLADYFSCEFKANPSKIWESNMFGKSLCSIVKDGLLNKLKRMPPESCEKLRQTTERIINEGCNGLICIIL
ncbi:MAG: stage IV sporulation protein A [Firmicutes bacterium]|nr:stage IV sporulation protein A [Bacillota bacterium]